MEDGILKSDWSDCVGELQVLYWSDISYEAVGKLYDGGACCKIEVRKTKFNTVDEVAEYCYEDSDGNDTLIRDDGEIVFVINVKFDGCANFLFAYEAMHHTCSREQLQNYGTALRRCSEFAEYIFKANDKHWCGS